MYTKYFIVWLKILSFFSLKFYLIFYKHMLSNFIFRVSIFEIMIDDIYKNMKTQIDLHHNRTVKKNQKHQFH